MTKVIWTPHLGIVPIESVASPVTAFCRAVSILRIQLLPFEISIQIPVTARWEDVL